MRTTCSMHPPSAMPSSIASIASWKRWKRHYPELVTPDSPTQRVGGKAVGRSRPFKHRVPMLSIRTETDTSADAAAKFDARIRRELNLGEDDPPVEYMAELKFDGLAISLRYERGFARRCGHAWRRRSRRGRDSQRANDPCHSTAAAWRRRATRCAGGPRRGVHDAPRFRAIERAAASRGTEDAISIRATRRPAPCGNSIRP